MAGLTRTRGWSLEFVLWELAMVAGNQLLWSDAMAEGIVLRQVRPGAGAVDLRRKFEAVRGGAEERAEVIDFEGPSEMG